jgi:uncharacterized protein (DUF2236 family)
MALFDQVALGSISADGERMTATLIGREDLEHQIARVRAAAGDSAMGIFGPNSLTWRVDREAALFLGAGRALLLQLAHPWIAAAIADHSQALPDPIGRFHRTFSIMFSIIFGTVDQAVASARGLHERHAQISGTLGESAGPFLQGSSYLANELNALRWVSATLTETSVIAHDLVLPALSEEERQCYYSENKSIAALFGIPPALLPPDWETFMAYNEEMWRSDILTVTPTARVIAGRLLWQPERWPRVPKWYRALTARLLPPPVREGFGLPYGPGEQKSAEDWLKWIGRVYRGLPASLRFVGPYHEAVGRLAGKPRPNLRTQILNRIWLGRSALG